MKGKRILSMALCLLMLAGTFPISAFAASNAEPVVCAHSGGEADCTAQAVCEICGESYGELAAHSYNEGLCSVCGEAEPSKQPEEAPDVIEQEKVCICGDKCAQNQADISCAVCAEDASLCIGEEKGMTADELAELFRALPAADSITRKTTEAEKEAIMLQLVAASDAYDAMLENDPEEAAVFAEKYAQLYEEAMKLNDALTGNESALLALIEYKENDKNNLTITIQGEDGKRINDATVTVTRGNNTYEVEFIGNGQYVFTRDSTNRNNYYSITVTAPGYDGDQKSIRGNSTGTSFSLEEIENLDSENWQSFRVYYIATGQFPDRYAGAGDTANYGPSGDNTPLVIINVDINKLRREYSDVILYQENTDGNDYHLIPSGAPKDMAAAQSFWAAVKSCMDAESIAAFQATGLYEDYVVYVLKRMSSGAQHADGVLSKVPPVYVIELYHGGDYFYGFATDSTGTFRTMDDVRNAYSRHIGQDITWNGNTGIYITADNAYTITITQSNAASARPVTGSEIKYQPKNNTNTYYVATFESSVREGAEGYHIVKYTDGVLYDNLFADQTYVVAEGDTVPAFEGDPIDKRPGYTFTGWVLEGSDKLLSADDIAKLSVDSDMVFDAQWELIPTEFEATVEVVLNDSYPSDINNMLGVSSADIYVSADGSKYYKLERSAVGEYKAMIPNGTYFTYYSLDGGASYTKIDERVFIIANAEGSRKVKFNSVSYDLNGGTADPAIPEINIYHAGTAVNVVTAVPQKSDYLFAGWKSNGGDVYQSGEQLTDSILSPYTLTAQWTKAVDVNVTVIIKHGNDTTDRNANVSFSLVELRGTTTVHTGYSASLSDESHDGYTQTEDSEQKTIVYTPDVHSFYDLPEANYTVNCFKAGYEVSVSKEVKDGTHYITLTLDYVPDDFALSFDVKMADSAMDNPELWPQAVRVKAVRWQEDGWVVVPQHKNTDVRVPIGENGIGSAQVNVPQHWPDMADQAADYRVIVTAYIMPDGTTVTAGHTAGAKYPSSNGIYLGVITVEGESRLPTYPSATDIPAAYYDPDEDAQKGTPTVTVSVNSYSVTFKADTVSGAMVEGKSSHTVEKQIKIPAFSGYSLTAPGVGYVFDAWYSKDGSKDGEWGEKIVAGTAISSDTVVYAKWKAPLKIKGEVHVAGSYIGEDGNPIDIYEHDRAKTVTIVLRKQGLGGHISTVDVSVAYSGSLGSGYYEFTDIPDDGGSYYIEERAANYSGRYQNEPESLSQSTAYDSYTETDNRAIFQNDPKVATVNAYLDFDPASFALAYEVDATAISKDFRPESAEVLVTYKGGSLSPDASQWPVISQMINGGKVLSLTDGFGSSSYPVWNGYSDGSALYDYGLRVEDISGLGDYSGSDLPYSITYQAPAYYTPNTPTGQSKMLKAVITPNKYAINYVLGADSTVVSGMGNAATEHTWSFETVIDAKPVRSGYEFLGWYDNDKFEGEPVSAIAADWSEESTLYAKWLQVQDKVDMTVTIIHKQSNGNGLAGNYEKELFVQLTESLKDSSDPYEDVAGMTRSYDGSMWHTFEDGVEKEIFTVTSIFSKLSSAYAYNLNVSLDGYYVTEKIVNPVYDEETGITTYEVDITLQYKPDLLQISVNAEIAEGIDEALWPVSAEVKINSWYDHPHEDIGLDWNHITQHEESTLTVSFGSAGRGSVSYPVWQWYEENSVPYYYRMEVVSLHLKDGSIVIMSGNAERYTGGNYIADIVTDASCKVPLAPTGTALAGAFGVEGSSGYEQSGTVTAVISTDIWKDDTPDHMQAEIRFRSADESMGTVGGKISQIFDLDNEGGIYKKAVTPKEVELSAKTGYKFSHWIDENGIRLSDPYPFGSQEVFGGKSYVYTAVWAPIDTLEYTVKHLKLSDNGELATVVHDSMTYGDTVIGEAQKDEFEGFVFDHAEPESIVIGMENNLITLYYAEDSNGDSIADYKQAFVNFTSAENGSVSGDNLQQVFTFTEAAGYTGYASPAEVEKTPDTGFKFSHWSDAEGNTVNPFAYQRFEGGMTYVFTANWTERTNYSYTVKYLNKFDNSPVADEKKVDNVTFNSYVTETAVSVDGYALDGADVQSFRVDAENEEIVFYYNIREDLTLTVRHLEYGTNTPLHPDTVTYNVKYNYKPNLEVVRANINGYKYHSTTPESITIGTDETKNVVTVYYEKDTYDYTVEYYFDGVLDSSLTETKSALYKAEINTYTDKCANGYTLDYVQGLPLTVSYDEASNVIRVHYATDVIGEDNIPDKYQATITYKIVNGTWNSGGSADIVHIYTLYKFDSQNGPVLKDPAPTLKDKGIPTGKGNEADGYMAEGKWDIEFNGDTAVDRNRVFTLFFDHKHYNISAQVFNGSVKMGEEDFVSPLEVHHNKDGETVLVFSPDEGYALDTVTVDGDPATLKADGSISLNHTNNHSVTVVYYPDVNHNGVPDKYEAVITFNIVNGVWKNGDNEPIVEVFPFYTRNDKGVWVPVSESSLVLGSKLPKDMSPASGFTTDGQWIQGITAATPVTGDANYTFAYTDSEKHLLTVKVINGTVVDSEGKPLDSEQILVDHEDAYTTDEDSSSFTFSAKPGYTIESIRIDGDNEDFTLGENTFTKTLDHDDDHSIVVVYAEDKLGDDNIPDTYQATVTYNVVNGTWSDNTTQSISHLFTLYEKGENGIWELIDPAPVLGDTLPEGMSAAEGHHGGAWNTEINANTAVTRDASYTYSYSLDYYTITVVVINGTAEVGGTAVESITVPYSADGKTLIDFAPAASDYLLYSVTVDGNNDELDSNSSYTFDNHSGHHHIRVVYEQDRNGDNEPDKYQKKVTYHIVNGTWGNTDKTDIVEYLVLKTNGEYDVNGKATLTVPTNMMPAEGYVYEGAAWDVVPPTEVSGTDEVVYIYRYSEKEQISIIIEVIGGTSNPVHSSTVYDYDNSRHTITFAPFDGYILDSAQIKSGDISDSADWSKLSLTDSKYEHDHSKNEHIKVVYAKDSNGDNVADYKQVFIEYRSADNGSVSGTLFKAYKLEDIADVNAFTPDSVTKTADPGYSFNYWTDRNGNKIYAEEIENIKVAGGETYVFTANWVERDDLSYTVKYLDEDEIEIHSAKTVNTAVYKSSIFAADEKLDIEGYTYIGAEKEELVIELSDNVLILNYGKDLWKDAPNGEDSQTEGDGIPDSKQALIRFVTSDETQGVVSGKYAVQVFTGESGTLIVPREVTTTAANGYQLDHWKENDLTECDPYYARKLVGGTETSYVAYWEVRQDLSFTVRYVDNSGNLIKTETIPNPRTVSNQTFGDEIETEQYVEPINGYVFEHAKIGEVVIDKIVIGTGNNYFDLVYAEDKNGDQIADYKQFFVNFFSADETMGTVSHEKTQVFNLAKNAHGEYAAWKKPLRAENESESGVIVSAKPGYVEDYWTRQGETSPVNPFAEIYAEGGKTVNFVIHFAKDEDNSGFADKYEASVTYKVYQGFWNSEKDAADKTVTFMLYEKNVDGGWSLIKPAVSLGDTIPDVSKTVADESKGFTTPGHWGNKDSDEDDPTSTTAVVDGAVYTYSFSELIPYDINVSVDNGSFTVGDKVVSSPVTVSYGENLKLDFKAKQEDGMSYALESVSVDGNPAELEDDGSYSFSNVRENHSIHVVYSTDSWSDSEKDDDPDSPGDGIADSFQIRVNYHASPEEFGSVSKAYEIHTILDAEGKPAKQGSVQLVGSEASAKAADSTGVYEFVDWTDSITSPAPGTTSGAIGTEALLKLKLENVSGGSEYNYYANFRYKLKISSVYIVEHYIWDETEREYLIDDDATFMGRAYVGDEVEAEAESYTGYAVNYNKSVIKGVVTEVVPDPINQQPGNILTLKLYYDTDVVGENGEMPDDIPDIFQKKIVFSIVNGVWGDLARLRSSQTERVIYLTLLDDEGQPSVDGKAKLTTPTDMQPDYGYWKGAWDQEPPEEVSGNEAVTYTYRYTKMFTPQTGDDSNLIAWFGAMCMSFAGVLGSVIALKRKKKNAE